MGKVRVRRRGSLGVAFRKLRRGLPQARLRLLGRIGEDWVDVVQSTAHEAPPAPRNTIITRISGRGYFRLTLGWLVFKDGRAASERRLEQRKKIIMNIIPKRMRDFDLKGR